MGPSWQCSDILATQRLMELTLISRRWALNNRSQFFLRGQDSGAVKMNLWSDGGATFTGHIIGTSQALSTTLVVTGDVALGAASDGSRLYVYKAGDGQRPVKFETSNSGTALTFYNDTDGWAVESAGTMRFATGGTTVRMSISAAGTVDVVGTFTAGTKTFKIDHPLPDKADGYHLVHSSIEGPRADLITGAPLISFLAGYRWIWTLRLA